MKKTVLAAMAMVACLVVGGVANATVTYDATTGLGFAGKGDVQFVLGLNNAQLQSQATSLVFTSQKVDTYQVENAWASGNIDNPVSLNSHTMTVTKSATVSSKVNADPRKVNGQTQFTGFYLLGNTNVITLGEVPVVSPLGVTSVTYSWTTQEWDGTYHLEANPSYNGHNQQYIQVKNYVTVTHTSDQLPAYIDPITGLTVLYTEGDNKAVVSVTLLDSVVTLYVNGVSLPITPPIVTP